MAEARHPGLADGRRVQAVVIFLECGDMSPLSDWQTCLPVPKRGHVRALQNGDWLVVLREKGGFKLKLGFYWHFCLFHH